MLLLQAEGSGGVGHNAHLLFCYCSRVTLAFYRQDDDLATMTLVPQGGEDSTIKTSIKIVSPEASHMKTLVHAYFVRYVMPKKAKELEKNTKKKKKKQNMTGRKQRRGSTNVSQGSEKKGKRRRSSVHKSKDKP